MIGERGYQMPLLFFHFPLTIFNLNDSIRATWLREGVGKPARAEAAEMGKKAVVSSFAFATPRLATADLKPKTDPERSEGTRHIIKIKLLLLYQ